MNQKDKKNTPRPEQIWVTLLLCFLIYTESKGDVLFKQTRIGLDKSDFVILKFKRGYVTYSHMKNTIITLLVSAFSMVGCSIQPETEDPQNSCASPTIDLVHKGVTHIGFNNDSALFYLNQAEKLDSMCFKVNYNLIQVYTSFGDFKNVFHVNNRLLKMHPNNPQYLMRAGICMHFLGNTEEERRYLGLASDSYKKHEYQDLYQGNTQIDSLAFWFEVEMCHLLLGDESASTRINSILDDESNVLFDREYFYDPTPNKFYNYLNERKF